MINKYRAILFDFDFTLCDSSQGQVECVNYALNKMGFEESEADHILKFVGLSLEEMFVKITYNSAPENQILFRKYFTERADIVIAPSSVMYSGVDTLFSHLRSKKKQIGIVSTKYRYRIETILSDNALLDQVDVIIGGEDVTKYKPDPEPMFLALNRLGVHNRETLYIGDSLVDAEVAKVSDVNFVAVLSGKTSKEEFEPYKPYAILEGVHELLDQS